MVRYLPLTGRVRLLTIAVSPPNAVRSLAARRLAHDQVKLADMNGELRQQVR
jgi:hypothetical protein